MVMKSNGLKLNEKSCIWLQKYPEISSKYFSVWSKRPINKSYYACVSCNRRDKAEHRTGSGDGKKEHVINLWLLFCLCSSPACHANTHTGTALCYLHTEGSVLCCYCAGPSHTWLPPHEQKLCSQAALVCLGWVDLSLFAFPAALQTVPFQSRGCRIFKSHEKQGTPISSQLWELQGSRIVCLPKCMPVTDPKHNHSLIVLMRLQLEMSQCCHLTKEQNKHQIHLEEKKKSPWLSCEQAAGWSGFQICGVQPLISFPF